MKFTNAYPVDKRVYYPKFLDRDTKARDKATASVNGAEVSEIKEIKIANGVPMMPEEFSADVIVVVAAYDANNRMTDVQFLGESLEITVPGSIITEDCLF